MHLFDFRLFSLFKGSWCDWQEAHEFEMHTYLSLRSTCSILGFWSYYSCTDQKKISFYSTNFCIEILFFRKNNNRKQRFHVNNNVAVHSIFYHTILECNSLLSAFLRKIAHVFLPIFIMNFSNISLNKNFCECYWILHTLLSTLK